MHVTRDRLSRPVDISSLLPSAKRRVNVVVDKPGLRSIGLNSMKFSTGQSSGGSGKLTSRRTVGVGVQRTRHYRHVNRPFVGQENRRPWGLKHGQRRGTCLPSWYPRTPLRDITAIVRAIERKRAKIRDDQTEASQADTDVSVPKTKLENEINISTSISLQCEVKAGNVDNKGKDIETSTTPQKTLLNSIDEVRQIWLEDQQKLEKTPAAKAAERQRKMRVLRSMR